MKSKVSAWGNSHGIRMTAPVLEHLNVAPGDELDFKLTDKGIEILKNIHSEEYVRSVAEEVINEQIEKSEPVKTVDDPYAESDVGYLLIKINPCKPVIREVSKDTPGAYHTLIDAKEAARQVIQNAIADAKESLNELRQIGVQNITYIAL
jgi:antitoxin component of MazEF toxin-antitoxin module